jgi:type I restriction enzyme S subunit
MPGEYPYFGANGQVDIVGDYLFDGDYILLAEDGGYFDDPNRNVAYQASGKFWVNNHAHILSPEAEIPHSFITKILNTLDWMPFVSGTTRLKLTQGGMQRIKVPLPPLAEQRRIVAKLDTLTARLDRARADLGRVPPLVRLMKQEVLTKCFNQSVGIKSSLGALLKGIESGKNMRCDERPPNAGERGVVKVSAVTWGSFDAAQSKTLPADYTPPGKARIRLGDVLISRANTVELVGAVVLVQVEPENLYLSDKILRLILDEDLKQWVLWFLRSPSGRDQIEKLATGNQLSMRNISQDALRSIQLPVPDKQARDILLATITSSFARADRLDFEAARAKKLLDRIESTILAKAFRGELVSQNPNDEPASALLTRIRAKRAAVPISKRRTKKYVPSHD